MSWFGKDGFHSLSRGGEHTASRRREGTGAERDGMVQSRRRLKQTMLKAITVRLPGSTGLKPPALGRQRPEELCEFQAHRPDRETLPRKGWGRDQHQVFEVN